MEKIDEKSFDSIINYEDLTLIDFSANWCTPCRMLKPILERVEPHFPDCKFCNVDVDECEEIAKKYRIFSVPTIVCFRNGRKIDNLVGLNSYDEIVAFINRCLKINLPEEEE